MIVSLCFDHAVYDLLDADDELYTMSKHVSKFYWVISDGYKMKNAYFAYMIHITI